MQSQDRYPIAPLARKADAAAVAMTMAILIIPFELVSHDRFPEIPFAFALAIATLFALFAAVRLYALHRMTTRLWRNCLRADATLEAIGDGIITTDLIGRLVFLNSKAEAMLGLPADKVRGKTINAVLQTAAPARANHPCAAAPLIEPHVTALRDDEGNCIGNLIVMRDVTRIRSIIAQLGWHTTHDTVTGLVNRAAFERQAITALRRSKEFGEPSYLCLINLDQFKVINDLGGHRAGDRVLHQVAGRLAASLYRCDTLARWVGDEFVMLLENCTAQRGLQVCRNILETAETWRFTWDDREFRVGMSIGVVEIHHRVPDFATLLRDAETACQTAKENGRKRIEFYQPSDDNPNNRCSQTAWADRISQAIDHDRYCLYYQRYANLCADESRIHGEVLVRMLNDSGDLILPEKFLPAAERYQLMPQLDRWVIRTAFSKFMEFGCNNDERWSINLSGQSLSPDIFNFIIQESRDKSVPPQSFCFEITETAAIQNITVAAELVRKLRNEGFTFALDDFGCGLSSFSYLKSIPLDYVKIDGSMPIGLTHTPTRYSIFQ
ncbi:MAG: EAL domain-containing protein, partial [Rhodospirillaceae bacterium]